MKYIESSIKKYLDDLSAKLPAPGGGSAAALISATGVSCLLMTANFTVDKKDYEQYQDEIKKIISQLSTLNSQLSTLIDEDVAAYTALSETYKPPHQQFYRWCGGKLPKNTDNEIKERNEKIQSALKNSLSVPCKIFEISVKALPSADRLKDIGNKNLLSDVACGVSILRAGIESAKFNIDVNLKYIKDTKFNEETKNKYDKMLKTAFDDIDKIIKKIK